MVILSQNGIIEFVIHSIFGCKLDQFPIKYLGVPIRRGKLKKSYWYPIIDRIKRKLEDWKARYLSLGGRIILINSVPSSTPSISCLFFCCQLGMDKVVHEKIDTILSMISKRKFKGIAQMASIQNL